jgi:hypothetical protein
MYLLDTNMLSEIIKNKSEQKFHQKIGNHPIPGHFHSNDMHHGTAVWRDEAGESF